ncbi:MAG: DUF4147 domain-containing protein [Vicinamibacterales bacterium]
MDRSAPDQLAARALARRTDALVIARAGIDAVAPHRLVPAAVAAFTARHPGISAWYLIAAGKAAVGMYDAFRRGAAVPPRASLVIAPEVPASMARDVEFVRGGHPFATEGSLHGGLAALRMAQAVPADGGLVCLLSGGASALMAAPVEGIDLAAKQRAVAHAMTGGADITALNTLRKHLSRVKGGRLAAACAGRVVTLALSDVIGDDLSVIGSGPTVPDRSTWHDARAAVQQYGGWDGLDPSVRAVLDAGCRGDLPDTPKPGDPRLARASAEVIGGRRQAMAGARQQAEALGYEVVTLDAPVRGEARDAARGWWQEAAALARSAGRRCAVISSGETTVRVRGRGRGGRNQEFATALVDVLTGAAGVTVASIGTDGIDGPTDAAGAVVDASTAARAAAAGRAAAPALADNDCLPFLDASGDLVRIGPTGTNVGDLQVLLADPA